ncbi:MAG: isoleucine--tRNA ligase [Bacteroidetes bacterium]|nr:MAG: isoleucine--tRNA ligase [Bacteroidota bacterium]
MGKYPDYSQLNLPKTSTEIQQFWEEQNIFEKSLEKTEGKEPFIFFEGPPSANGMPGIHHMMARTIKDIFCRYKTLKGYYVKRKAGWDTHGLPVEMGVEKKLGITKEDIGKSITVAEYNASCRTEVMKYKDEWDKLTKQMGYWVDLDDPYITFENKYIETLWYLLKELYKKGLLYKGYTIQPYSPAAGTGLSTHELNQPGCYRDVKDTTVTAQFEVVRDEKSEFLFEEAHGTVTFLAWTTTPWTLPSNTALAVGDNISYVVVQTFNQYTGKPITVLLAKDLMNAHFNPKNADLPLDAYKEGDKKVPFKIVKELKGKALIGLRYQQLISWVQPDGDAFRVISGDYVTTEDGTGIVHIAPTFGADDKRVALEAGIAPLLLIDKDGQPRPMVDLRGRLYPLEALQDDFITRFVNEEAYKAYAGRFVKNDYDPEASDPKTSLDIDLAIMLKYENKAFKVEKYTHNYPHCWRTDKPVLYYPLDSWFIRTTAVKERMIALNKTINWKPKATGTGRFGNWLENLQDWNLSRSRFWGTPLPIWRTEDGKEERCIGSVKELYEEIEKSVAAGIMTKNPMADFTPGDYSAENYQKIDLHRPYMDEIVLVAPSGKTMHRESDLIDVWFDSGAMPYAQYHYPFEHKEDLDTYFPADFIAEGVDQTRGWFYTLHAIATMTFDSVAYKTCVSNGLVLDKNGNKMSKRLGNAVDPFQTIAQYGPDATRWYMITNAQPWDNLKFNLEGIAEVQRKFFGTLYNTYSFFALYANIDGFTYKEAEIPIQERPEIDRWILSELNTLIKVTDEAYENYEPTRAGRAISTFVSDHLSNWFVRLSRRRFWKGDYSANKISAYQTLYTCMETVAKLIAPIAPFFAERLFLDLNETSQKEHVASVHLTDFPTAQETLIDKKLEERMQLAQQISSMVLSLRKKTNIRVRQPLAKIMIPVNSDEFTEQVEKVKNLILSEVNVKEIEYLTESGILVKKIKPNFKALGPKYGKMMKQISGTLASFSQEAITELETKGTKEIILNEEKIVLSLTDVEITTEDIPGWVVANEGLLTVALDISITDELRNEGYARELVNKIQNIRKDQQFEVTDKIKITLENRENLGQIVKTNYDYICTETLTQELSFTQALNDERALEIDLTEGLTTHILVEKK